MSVRILTQAVVVPGPQVVRHRRWVKYHQPVERARPVSARRGSARGWFARFEDDRDLTGLKVAIVGAVIVIVMLLEVPW